MNAIVLTSAGAGRYEQELIRYKSPLIYLAGRTGLTGGSLIGRAARDAQVSA